MRPPKRFPPIGASTGKRLVRLVPLEARLRDVPADLLSVLQHDQGPICPTDEFLLTPHTISHTAPSIRSALGAPLALSTMAIASTAVSLNASCEASVAAVVVEDLKEHARMPVC